VHYLPEDPVCGDTLREACDHVFWSNGTPVEQGGFHHGQTVFCKIDEVWRLFRSLRRRRIRVVVVTGEGDLPVDEKILQQCPPQVSAWFGTNVLVDQPWVHPLPLGLGNAGCRKTLKPDVIQQLSTYEIRREERLFANFSKKTRPEIRTPLWDALTKAALPWITLDPPSGDSFAYGRQLFSHRYVLCPPGNGEDTHRFWEAISCGAIPVARLSNTLRRLGPLPALLLDELWPLSHEQLQRDAERLAGSQSPQFLSTNYWFRRVQEDSSCCASLPVLTPAEFMRGWFREVLRIARLR